MPSSSQPPLMAAVAMPSSHRTPPALHPAPPGLRPPPAASSRCRLPAAVTWALLLSLACGTALQLWWSLKSPARSFQVAAVLTPVAEVTAFEPAPKLDEIQAEFPDIGWPACIPNVRGRIESMAQREFSGKVWHSADRQTGSPQPDPASAGIRQLLQGSTGTANGGSSGGGAAAADAPGSPAKDGSSSSKAAGSGPGANATDGPAAQVNSTGSSQAQQPQDAKQPRKVKTQPTSLLAIATANIWDKTELLLQSLAATDDAFEVLVVDELSDDETPQRLREYGIRMVTPPERFGVTYNWNLAYRTWLETEHEWLFYVNNDVLVPDGAIDALAQAMTKDGGDCDLVTPQSTVRSKGFWGPVEGLELLLNLTAAGSAFVNNPLNFRRVQDALTGAGCVGQRAVQRAADVQLQARPGFSGFFFGVRRAIQQWALDEDNLFDPANRLFGQETDLNTRSQQKQGVPKAKVCVHTGAFVFHYKGGTITGDGAARRAWHMQPKQAPGKG